MFPSKLIYWKNIDNNSFEDSVEHRYGLVALLSFIAFA